MCNMPTNSLHKRPLGIDELDANHYRVSVHKYGFFLCRRGTARILLGNQTYLLSPRIICASIHQTHSSGFSRKVLISTEYSWKIQWMHIIRL